MTPYETLSAIVTGGASGIGLATARLLSERGARVAIIDANNEAIAIASSLPQRSATTTTGQSSFKPTWPYQKRPNARSRRPRKPSARLNAVVNSAGIQRYGAAEQTPLELWREVLDVNLTAAFLVSRAAIPHLRR